MLAIRIFDMVIIDMDLRLSHSIDIDLEKTYQIAERTENILKFVFWGSNILGSHYASRIVGIIALMTYWNGYFSWNYRLFELTVPVKSVPLSISFPTKYLTCQYLVGKYLGYTSL